MSTKCQYKPGDLDLHCAATRKTSGAMRVGHHADQADPDDQVDGVQPGHEEIKNKKHLHLLGFRSGPARPADRSCSGT